MKFESRSVEAVKQEVAKIEDYQKAVDLVERKVSMLREDDLLTV